MRVSKLTMCYQLGLGIRGAQVELTAPMLETDTVQRTLLPAPIGDVSQANECTDIPIPEGVGVESISVHSGEVFT